MLRIKKNFEGMIISRLHPGVGTITFDPTLVRPEQYENFIVYGFDFMFEEAKLEKPRKNSIKEKIKSFELVGDGEITAINLTDNPIMPGVTFSSLDKAVKESSDYQKVNTKKK
jgi:hypothetical protein